MRIVVCCTLLGLAGCYDDCHPKAKAGLTLGTGDQSYRALDPADPTYSLVHGPQGGWHVVIGMEAAGLDATQIATADLVGTIGGAELARNDDAWLTFQCDADARTLRAWNTFLIYDVESAAELDGVQTTIQATVTDSRGVIVTDTIIATIVDDWQE
ncbi:MAG: hypothetical protein ACI9MC_002617 [Kiritimatiellia bacterium]|jgi:hypothetical protein